MSSVDKQIAEKLLAIEAIKLSPEKPFVWASGWNSPIYCDNRLSLSFPEARTLVKDALAQRIKESFEGVEAIVGVATAGIPQGVLVAEALGLPFLYVRSKPKGHGLENMIEGKLVKGQKVVVIEDLVSTGGSSLKAVEALREVGVEVMGMTAIFTYGFGIADTNFENANVKLETLSNYDALIDLAIEKGLIASNLLEELKSWRTAPELWKK